MEKSKKTKAPDRVEIKRRQQRKRAVTTVILVFVLIVATVLSLTVFFNITAIEINGTSSVYTDDEILQSLKIEAGQNIFLFSTKQAESEVAAALPFLDNIKIVRKLPNTVVIDITETKTSLALPYAGGSLILSDGLKILENVKVAPDHLTMVYGIAPNTYKVGSQLDTDTEEGVEYLDAMVQTLKLYGLLGDTTIINVSDTLNLSLVYDGRIFVMLGTANNLDYKISMLKTLVSEKIGTDETGSLDISLAGKGIFKQGELILPDGYQNFAQSD